MKKVILTLLFLFIIYFIFINISSTVTQNIDDHIYSLPYQKGASHKVVQAYGGLFSHNNIAAIDFNMPVGTPIHAAREGVIYNYKEDSNEGGILSKYKNKANYIIIKHTDGSFGCYWHLMQNGVTIKKGKVQKGDLIGYSGNTGFALQPHLHFAVKRVLNYDMNSYVQTKFYTSEGVVILKNGESYSSNY
jgi:murein DD-endopeptidase MepM/ murein hydrolase activator NlpD